MILVCKHHVTQGLKQLPVPHVKKLSHYAKQTCYFCEQKASVKLFMPYARTSESKLASIV